VGKGALRAVPTILADTDVAVGTLRFAHPTRLWPAQKRRVGKGALRAVPTHPAETVVAVGTLRFAHPTR